MSVSPDGSAPVATAAASSSCHPEPQKVFGPAPVAAAARLSPQSNAAIKSAANSLALDKLNAVPEEAYHANWNPFWSFNVDEAAAGLAAIPDPAMRKAAEQRVQAMGLLKSLVGPFQHASEMFQGKTLVPIRDIVGGMVAQRTPPEQAVLSPVLAALPPAALLRTPAHQFNVDGRADNRILVFSSDKKDEQGLNDLIAELGRQHKRVVVQWVHVADKKLGESSQGGTMMDVLGGRIKFGSSHISGFSSGLHTVDSKTGLPLKAGASPSPGATAEVRPTRVTTNWGDRSNLDDAQRVYATHLYAIDYQAGCYDQIPDATLAAYKRNADMWDCLAALHVKFASDGDTFGYNTYFWNPLEIHDQASAADIAQKLANDWDTFADKHGSFYCAEAQYSIASLGPLGATLLKQSKFGNTKAGALIRAFGEAEGYKGKPIEWCRQHPEIGWQHLIDLAQADKGGVKSSWLYPLLGVTHGDVWGDTYSNRQTIFLEFIPEDIQGWEAYRPRNPDRMIATPMSTGMITWSLMHQYLPTEGVTVLLLRELVEAYKKGDAAVKTGIAALAGGADPLSRNGQVALAVLCSQLAGGFVLATLEDKTSMAALSDDDKRGLSAADLQAMSSYAQVCMLQNSGYSEITSDADKAKVRQIWDLFLGAMKDPGNWTLEQLRASIHAVDSQVAKVEVERKTPSGALAKGLMRFVPPGAWGFWAQHPDFCQSHAVQYVATAIHRDAAKPAAPL